MVKVSVICVAYNQEKYIRDCLDSLVCQKTDFEYEVLINDDASSDRTPEIIREYAERYPGIIRPFLQEKNLFSQGINILEHVMLSSARGEYFAFIDGDDYWTSPEKLQLQADILDKNPQFSACAHNTLWHDCTGAEPDKNIYDYEDGTHIRFQDAVKGMPYHTSSMMVRRQFIDSRPDFYYEAGMDGDDYPQAIWNTMNGDVYYIDAVMSVYRSRSGPKSWSTVANFDKESLSRHFRTKLRILNKVRNHVSGERLAATERTILEFEYYLLELNERFSELKESRFHEIYSEKPFSYRLKLFVKIHFSRMFSLIKKIRG